MKIIEIVGDTWEQRFAKTKRQQDKSQKARAKLTRAQAAAADQARTAAAARARTNDRIADAKRDLATQPET